MFKIFSTLIAQCNVTLGVHILIARRIMRIVGQKMGVLSIERFFCRSSLWTLHNPGISLQDESLSSPAFKPGTFHLVLMAKRINIWLGFGSCHNVV